MSEAEKQEGQKTVVAFIAGLLIGGLLVWVFSASPETKSVPNEEKADTEEVRKDEAEKGGAVAEVKKEETAEKTTPKVSDVKPGDAKLAVKDQPAGLVVVLEESKYPAMAGWVVVRDYVGGVSGNILGAARFNTDEGLTPASVNLLRATTAGNNYQVVYYSSNGDKVFDLNDDLLIEGVSANFKAQ